MIYEPISDGLVSNLSGRVVTGLSTCPLIINKSKKDICGVIFLSRVDGIFVILIVTMAFILLYSSSAMLWLSLFCKDYLQVTSLSFSCVCSINASGPSTV